MKQFIIILSLLFVPYCLFSQTKTIDIITFGNISSEKSHRLQPISSEIIKGGLGEQARILLPIEDERVEGGNVTFKMKVNPGEQNYFTLRLWGSDIGKGNILILFCEGKQVGYRHLGDYDVLDISNDEAPCPGRFIYITSPLPRQMTNGKNEVTLAIRSTGPIWGYGETLDKYQKPMTAPSKGLYKAYIHTDNYFVPPKNEIQGKAPQYIPVRRTPGLEVLDELKERVNSELQIMLDKQAPLGQLEMWVLTDAYSVSWAKAYHNEQVPLKIISSIDAFYKRFKENPLLAYQDTDVYNYEWLTTGPLSICIHRLVKYIRPVLDEKADNGKTRRENWSELLQASLDYAKTHRRHYTNQSMIIDWFMYEVNRALTIVDPFKAFPEFQTLRYLYESVGLVPWMGIDTPDGPQMPLGDTYYQLTDKGLTKELGFVGYYGEVLDWVVHLYQATGVHGIPNSGDEYIRTQMLKMMKARTYFRYPAVDETDSKAMRAEAVVGWRDGGHYPGNILYGDRGTAWDATPLMTAAATLDADAIAYAQQMFDDNQFFAAVADKLKQKGIRSTHSLLAIPDEYELIKKQPRQTGKLPMTEGMSDFVFADEEDGVVALKNGKDILYVSLYWRARNAVNFLAKIHHITPDMDKLATVFQDVKFTDSGMKYIRPDWINLGFNGGREFYPGVHSAHAGEVLPIAKIPDNVPFKPGDENVYAGKGDFYTLRYGNYLIGMNCSTDKNYNLEIPAKSKKVINLSDNKRVVSESQLTVIPRTTIVLYIESK